MAYALDVQGKLYYLVQEGRWFNPASSQGWKPALGGEVSVTGTVFERKDVRGVPFWVIEVMTLAPAVDAE